MFQSFDIQHFRGFSKLRLDGVGRVNLVVGQNNSGKTSLLEAITLLANPSMIKSLPGLFRANAGAVDERFYRWLPQDGVEHAGALLGSTSLGGETRLVALKQGMALGSLPGAELESAWKNEIHRLWHSKALTPLRVHAVSVQHRGPDSMIDALPRPSDRLWMKGRWSPSSPPWTIAFARSGSTRCNRSPSSWSTSA